MSLARRALQTADCYNLPAVCIFICTNNLLLLIFLRKILNNGNELRGRLSLSGYNSDSNSSDTPAAQPCRPILSAVGNNGNRYVEAGYSASVTAGSMDGLGRRWKIVARRSPSNDSNNNKQVAGI